jgi:hypothetical protein
MPLLSLSPADGRNSLERPVHSPPPWAGREQGEEVEEVEEVEEEDYSNSQWIDCLFGWFVVCLKEPTTNDIASPMLEPQKDTEDILHMTGNIFAYSLTVRFLCSRIDTRLIARQ